MDRGQLPAGDIWFGAFVGGVSLERLACADRAAADGHGFGMARPPNTKSHWTDRVSRVVQCGVVYRSLRQLICGAGDDW